MNIQQQRKRVVNFYIILSFLILSLYAHNSYAVNCIQARSLLTPEFCLQLEKTGIINVMCPYDTVAKKYDSSGQYAHPNDTCDDTAALQSAITRAGVHATVVLPAGTVSTVVAGESNPYIISKPIFMQAKSLLGINNSHSGHGTRIIVANNVKLVSTVGSYTIPFSNNFSAKDYFTGAMFYGLTGRSKFVGIVLNAKGRADFGIYLYRGHRSTIDNVTIRETRKAAIFSDASVGIRMDQLSSLNNFNDGIVVSGSNSGTLLRSLSQNDKRHGFVVTVRRGDLHTGEFTIIGGISEGSGGHGVYISGTRSPVTVQNLRIEGPADDGIRSEDAHHVQILNNRIFSSPKGLPDAQGDSENHAIKIIDCHHCTIRGNQMSGVLKCLYDGGAINYEDIWVVTTRANESRHLNISENIQDGGTGSYDLLHGSNNCGPQNTFDVVYVDTFGNKTVKSRLSQHQRVNQFSDSPPRSGPWRVGDIVWNRNPSVGEPMGWTCSKTAIYSHICLNWLAMGRL